MNLKQKKNFKNELEKMDIFKPYIVIILILAFIVVAIPSSYFFDSLPRPSFQVYIMIMIGIIFFIIGLKFPNIITKFSKSFKNKMNVLKTINVNKQSSALFFNSLNFKSLRLFKSVKTFKTFKSLKSFNLLKFLKSSKFFNSIELIILTLVLIGIVLQIINLIILGGIPLFSGILKAKAATKIWLFSYIFFIIGINILLSKFNSKIYYILLIIGLGLFTLTGYRTTPIAILLSAFITLYYSKNMKIKYQMIFISIIAILLIVIGFIAVQSIEWQHWKLNAIELLSYRAGFTLNILDRAIPLAGSTHGSLFYYTLTGFFKSIDPRVIVGEVIMGKTHSITSTIFGPGILDFGWIGMGIQMFFIGFILKLIHIIQKHLKGIATAFYGIILAQTIIWIETGPTDLVVWIFYFIGIILIIYYFYNIDSIAVENSISNTDSLPNTYSASNRNSKVNHDKKK